MQISTEKKEFATDDRRLRDSLWFDPQKEAFESQFRDDERDCRQNHYGNSTYELRGNVENGLEGKPPAAEVEEVFEARSEELHHQGIVLSARAEVVHLRYTLYMCVMNYTDRQSRSHPRSPPEYTRGIFLVLSAQHVVVIETIRNAT